MNEISLALLDKWRCSISPSGSGKEEFFKHNRASALMEAQPRSQRTAKKIMLLASRAAACGKAHSRNRRNITSNAT